MRRTTTCLSAASASSRSFVALIADPSSPQKGGIHWMTLHNLTDWIANKGYTALG